MRRRDKSVVFILINKEIADQTMAGLNRHLMLNSAVLTCVAAATILLLLGYDFAWAFHGPETDDSLLYMTTIKSRAQVYNTAAIKLHNRPFPLTSPAILFSKEDILANQLPFPYPGSLTELDAFLRSWMMTYHLVCAAAGDATAPFSYMVSESAGLERMANVVLYPSRFQGKEEKDGNNERGREREREKHITVIEKSSATTGTRLVQRLSAVEVKFVDMHGEKQWMLVSDETLAVCFQKYFPVQDTYADGDDNYGWSEGEGDGDGRDFTIS